MGLRTNLVLLVGALAVANAACVANCDTCVDDICTLCIAGWDGAGCDVWTAECDGHCFGCQGYGANSCIYCADHASRDWNNNCVCDPGWSGPSCQIYTSTTYHTNVGDCDPRCFGGCTGPTNMDCVRCCDHAHMDVYGACVCDSMWGGVSCNMY